MIRRTCRRLSVLLWVAVLGLGTSVSGYGAEIQGKKTCPADQWGKAWKIPAQVIRVYDGDTIHVKTEDVAQVKIRMLTIDTPELSYQGHTQGEWALRAAERLKEILPEGTPVVLELEAERCDQYGRLLAHVILGKKSVNRQMVEEGLAANYCIYPNIRHCEDYGKAFDQAEAHGRGFHDDPSLQIPYLWRSSVRKQRWSKYVGTTGDYAVKNPNHVLEVPVAQRVFFMKKSDVKSPYYLEQE